MLSSSSKKKKKRFFAWQFSFPLIPELPGERDGDAGAGDGVDVGAADAREGPLVLAEHRGDDGASGGVDHDARGAVVAAADGVRAVQVRVLALLGVVRVVVAPAEGPGVVAHGDLALLTAQGGNEN
jgi:hypothetical protein